MSIVKMNLGSNVDKIEKENCDKLSMILKKTDFTGSTENNMTCEEFLKFHEKYGLPRYEVHEPLSDKVEFSVHTDDIGMWGSLIYVKGLKEVIEVISTQGFKALSMNDYKALENLSCLKRRHEKLEVVSNENINRCGLCGKQSLFLSEANDEVCREHFKDDSYLGLHLWYIIHNVKDFREKDLLKRVHAKIKNQIDNSSIKVDKRTERGKNAITEFTGDYAFLSMDYEVPVEFEGNTFRCAETAFQAQSAHNEVYTSAMLGLTGSEAREFVEGKRFCIDWKDVEYGVLFMIIYNKFKQNPDLKRRLVETGDRLLYRNMKVKDKVAITVMCVRAMLMNEGI